VKGYLKINWNKRVLRAVTLKRHHRLMVVAGVAVVVDWRGRPFGARYSIILSMQKRHATSGVRRDFMDSPRFSTRLARVLSAMENGNDLSIASDNALFLSLSLSLFLSLFLSFYSPRESEKSVNTVFIEHVYPRASARARARARELHVTRTRISPIVSLIMQRVASREENKATSG